MNKKSLMIASFSSLLLANVAFASSNPASTDFVRQQIQSAISGLQTQFQGVLSQLQSQLAAQQTATAQLRTEFEAQVATQTYVVGQQREGGTVIYVDPNGTHGLIAANSDVTIDGDDTPQWGPQELTLAQGNGVYAGEMNTTLAVAAQSPDNSDFAVRRCADLNKRADGVTDCPPPDNVDSGVGRCYGDYYLPSAFELSIMALRSNEGLYQLNPVGYWSSTETSASEACYVDHLNEGTQPQCSIVKTASAQHVRCIRAF